MYIYIYRYEYVLTLLCNILHCNNKQITTKKNHLVSQQMKTVVCFTDLFYMTLLPVYTGVDYFALLCYKFLTCMISPN